MLPRILEPESMDSPEEAAEYDAMDHRGPNQAFVDRMAELGAGGIMLDVGSGPGHIPVMMARRFAGAVVVGVDLSAEMLKVAVGHARGVERIHYQQADAKRLPFRSSAFDTVFSNSILHHLSDPRPCLAEMVRVLRPGGVILIRDLFRPVSAAELDRIVQACAAVPERATVLQQAMFRASLMAALRPEELKQMVVELEIEHLQVVVDSDRHMSLQTHPECTPTP